MCIFASEWAAEPFVSTDSRKPETEVTEMFHKIELVLRLPATSLLGCLPGFMAPSLPIFALLIYVGDVGS